MVGFVVHLLAVAAIIVGSCRAALPKQPNILFIAADDLGWNDIGFHDNDAIMTPNLDKLATDGVILNRTYVQPLCSPTRSCFMSGRFPFHTGLQHIVISPERGFGLNLSITTVAQELKSIGYQTHIIGKWHLGFCNKKYTPTMRGFDTFFGYYLGAEDYYTHRRAGAVPATGEEGEDFGKMRSVDGLDYHHDIGNNYSNVLTGNGTYSTYAFCRQAVNVVNSHDPSKGPLYLYMPFQSNHIPLQAPQEYVDRYSHIKDKSRRIVSAMVTAMDDAIGNITEALQQRGFWENTLLVFTTDNGGPVTVGANNWPLRGSKATVWEGGTRGSAFLHGTMLNKTGYTYNGMMHAVDWYPTLLSAAGGGKVNYPEMDGMDMWDVLANNLTSPRTGFVYNIDHTGKISAIRVGRYKYIKGQPGSQDKWYPPATEDLSVDEYMARVHKGAAPEKGPWLFDIDADPLEKENLYSSMPDQVKIMEEKLAEYLKGYVPDLYSQYPLDPNCDPKLHGDAWSPGWC